MKQVFWLKFFQADISKIRDGCAFDRQAVFFYRQL